MSVAAAGVGVTSGLQVSGGMYVSGGVTAALSNVYVTVTLSSQVALRCFHRYRCGGEGNSVRRE
jgi:hypothetical protein